MPYIAIIEDDEDIRELVLYALANAQFECAGFENGAYFFKDLAKTKKIPDLILLDIMLPDTDGLAILRQIRAAKEYSEIPVIMLTAKGSEADKVKGLNLGADDYIAKPFGVTEMIARINAVFRRTSSKNQENKQDKEKATKITYKNLSLDSAKHEVLVGETKVELTYREFELLRYLLLNIDLVLSRDKLMDAVWGYDYEGESRTVDMHIKGLRQKLGEAGEYIKTVRNVGYKIGG